MAFAGERYLVSEVGLPNYEEERFWLVIKAVLIVIMFTVVLPVVLARKVSPNAKQPDKGEQRKQTNGPQVIVVKKVKKKKQKSPKPEKTVRETQPEEEIEEVRPSEQTAEAPLITLNLSCLLCLIALIMSSSNNRLTARTAYVAPFLTPEECRFVIDRAHEAAKRNVELHPENERLLKSPAGWEKDRHDSYPTTDLNVVTDPFTKEDRAFLEEKMNKRLAPVVERIYGIAQGAIRANDMFVVRYDAAEGQPFLEQHTDSSHVSFNVLLNDEFEGGGTRFHNRWTDEATTAGPHVGDVLINNANILHEGLPTTKGTRYILVGFTSIDRKDPFTGEPNQLSLFASWLSLPWVQVMMKHGSTTRYRKDQRKDKEKLIENKYAVSLFNDASVVFTMFGDILSPHGVKALVDPSNATDYLATMDAAPEIPGEPKAKWFSGQQIHMDVTGRMDGYWTSRGENEEAFEDL